MESNSTSLNFCNFAVFTSWFWFLSSWLSSSFCFCRYCSSIVSMAMTVVRRIFHLFRLNSISCFFLCKNYFLFVNVCIRLFLCSYTAHIEIAYFPLKNYCIVLRSKKGKLRMSASPIFSFLLSQKNCCSLNRNCC